MNKLFAIILIGIVIFFLLAEVSKIFTPITIFNTTINIEEGTTTAEIATILGNRGIIDSPSRFLIVASLSGSADKIRYGLFSFTGELSLLDVLKKLVEGEVVTHKLTIPEGYTVARIAYLVSQKGMGDYNTFFSLTRDTTFIYSLGLPVQSLEGFLFPDTYYVPHYADEGYIIRMMVDNFFLHWNSILPEEISFDSLYSVLILASIVEREAVYDDEKPLITGVYRNRLKRGMLLQADPTVAYALELQGLSRNKIYYVDLQIDSPYNTYRYPGLPPTPICNPGIQSIRAALNPEESEYLFFFAGENSRHIFSRTYTEHLRKLSEYRGRI
jgi:UPF0755 protein